MSLFRKDREESRTLDGSALTSFAVGGTSPFIGTTQSALRLIPLYAATAMIADAISILPYAGYQFTNGIRLKMQPQPQLTFAPHPNPIFTRVEWLHQYATSLLLRGNAYGLILDVDSFGLPSKVLWLNPDKMHVDEGDPGLPVYKYGGKEIDISTLIHIPWYPAPGSIVGLSPIGQFKQQIEVGLGAGKFANNWFKNGSIPSGHFKFNAGPLDPKQSAIVKQRFKEAVSGNDILVTGNDWEWQALAVKPEEAQFLETIKATANEIAAIYRVDPADIGGEAANSLTYSTLELNQIKFQVRALQPIFTRLEHHLSRLLPDYKFIKFNPDALIRTDTKTRAEVHELNLRTGMETQPEGRALEEKPPLTPAEIQFWKDHYSKAPAPAAAAPSAPPPKGGA